MIDFEGFSMKIQMSRKNTKKMDLADFRRFREYADIDSPKIQKRSGKYKNVTKRHLQKPYEIQNRPKIQLTPPGKVYTKLFRQPYLTNEQLRTRGHCDARVCCLKNSLLHHARSQLSDLCELAGMNATVCSQTSASEH